MIRCAAVWMPALALVVPLLAQEPPRVHTNRPTGTQLLKLPKEDDAFGFIVYGDRTGGPVEGIAVLRQAVTDTNLLDPDLVFTVGDLINGYNADAAWQAQAKEYKDAMAKLRMPWFPVAGNHDIYWRGEGKKPEGEHERNFEMTFGPLWYAVQHKQCWFLALYSDEGNPATGEKDFNKPECQRMSDAQFAWLGETLAKAKGARHVFVFLHHPRWLAQYGTDWERVHALLAKNGNVSAVFAGHIHRMRYDGKKDGIQYYTVASVGAHLEFEAPQAGYLHQYHVVTVRPGGITVAALPVGTPIDPQQITGKISEEVDLVHSRMQPALVGFAPAGGTGDAVTAAGGVDAVVTLRCENPSSRPVDYELIGAPTDGYVFTPDHQHVLVPAGGKATTTFALSRRPGVTPTFGMPEVEVRADYVAVDRRIGLPRRTFAIDLPPPADLGRQPDHQRAGVLVLDGNDACVEIPAAQMVLPDGPFTLEAWVRGEDFRGRRAIVSRTENSEFGLYGSDGNVSFLVWLGERYATAKTAAPVLTAGKWHHVAGVYDGTTVRAFVDGKPVAELAATGKRKTSARPLFVGADPNSSNAPSSFFRGSLDDVRLSKVARYSAAFTPPQRHEPDADTVWLLPCDEDFGPWSPDTSGHGRHGRRRGTAHSTLETR